MTTLHVAKYDGDEHTGTALLASDDSIWVAVSLRWWDVATLVFWWLVPSDKKGWATLTTTSGQRVRMRVYRVARSFVRIRNLPG